VLLKAVDFLTGLRVSPEGETTGLDQAEHNERGYNY
jgi:ammonia channel protein AmtB